EFARVAPKDENFGLVELTLRAKYTVAPQNVFGWGQVDSQEAILLGGIAMLQRRFGLLIVAVLTFVANGVFAAETSRPNIVFILADDLGYGELGCFGQTKIKTPNLDRLAAEGMRLTQHYAGNAVCAPSRCVLMTGKHPGHAFIRDNRSTPPEGQYPIPA